MAHVAIIMDGNRRWAAARGMPLVEGYRRGIVALRESVRAALEAGVDTLTVFGFSTENWRRERGEIDLLMQLCATFAAAEKPALQRQGVRVRVLGEIEPFAFPARAGLRDLVKSTQSNRRLTLNLALNYSGRAELVRAAQGVARDVVRGKLAPSEVDEQTLRARLYAPEMTDPDLLIRTGGELRISNFLLYQIAYSELLCLPVLWPDFGAQDFYEAVKMLERRERRFGA
jgi:undecaprenyl diphosphate synthase